MRISKRLLRIVLLVGVPSTLAFVVDLFGARDIACQIIPSLCAQDVEAAARQRAQDAEQRLEERRAAVLAAVNGAWTRVEGDCGAQSVTYAVEPAEPDGFSIRSSAPDGFEALTAVVAVDPAAGVVTGREVAPSGQGPIWEYRLHAGLLTLRDQDGVDTTLKRCGQAAASPG